MPDAPYAQVETAVLQRKRRSLKILQAGLIGVAILMCVAAIHFATRDSGGNEPGVWLALAALVVLASPGFIVKPRLAPIHAELSAREERAQGG